MQCGGLRGQSDQTTKSIVCRFSFAARSALHFQEPRSTIIENKWVARAPLSKRLNIGSARRRNCITQPTIVTWRMTSRYVTSLTYFSSSCC